METINEPDYKVQLQGTGINFRKMGATVHGGANVSVAIIGFIDGIVAEDSHFWKFRTVPVFV